MNNESSDSESKTSTEELKIGDKVIPMKGPHKGGKGTIVELTPNFVVIKSNNKYRREFFKAKHRVRTFHFVI